MVWVGPLTALTHTQCQSCGGVNCQVVEPEEGYPETRNSKGIQCPKCGHVHDDSYEYFDGIDGDAEIECSNCEAKLSVSKTVSITYSAHLKVNQ